MNNIFIVTQITPTGTAIRGVFDNSGEAEEVKKILDTTKLDTVQYMIQTFKVFSSKEEWTSAILEWIERSKRVNAKLPQE